MKGGYVVVVVGGAPVSVVPVVPVVLVVVGVFVDVDAGVFELEFDVAVGGWPGRGGWRLVVVATPEPLTLGATAVEVTGPPPDAEVPPDTAEPPLLTTTGGLAAPAAPVGSGGTGVMVELVSVATAPVAEVADVVMVVCVVWVCSVDSERLHAASRGSKASTTSATVLTGCILSQNARHAFAAAADRERAARAEHLAAGSADR
jgi:hypothetical protein